MRHPAFRPLLKFGAAVFLLAALFILPALPQAEGAIIYVTQTGEGGKSGVSWTNACGEEQFITRLGSAVAGDELWVAKGKYRPDLADITKSFILKSGVKVYGGFAGTETALDQRDWKTNETILSGELGVGINSYHVVDASNTDITTLLDGFRIIGGKATAAAPNNRGGGLHSVNGSLVIRNCTFAGNTAGQGGGGAIYQDGGSPAIENCIIAENTTPTRVGAGVLHLNLNSWIRNTTFSENSAIGGAALFISASTSVVTNCTFYGNEATEGAAVYNWAASNTFITNCTFFKNSATGEGSGIYADTSNLTVMNTILWNLGNSEIAGVNFTSAVSDSVIRNGYAGGTNIITADPKPAPLADNGGPTLTCAIASDSSALNAGRDVGTVVSGTIVVPNIDQRGVSRPQGSSVDIGAYEREVSPTPGGGGGSGCQSAGTSGTLWLMLPLGLVLLRRRN